LTPREFPDDNAADALERADLLEVEQARSIRIGAVSHSSKKKIAPSRLASHGVPSVWMKSTRQPPRRRPFALPPAIETSSGGHGPRAPDRLSRRQAPAATDPS